LWKQFQLSSLSEEKQGNKRIFENIVHEYAQLLVRWRVGRQNVVNLSSEIKVLRKTISEDTGTAIQALQFLKSLGSPIPNAEMV
jgi:hypothetical protein